jgi:hypothetical protein
MNIARVGSHQLNQLTEIFTIGISTYAILYNHTKTVVTIYQQRALTWIHEELINCQTAICKPGRNVVRYLNDIKLAKAE